MLSRWVCPVLPQRAWACPAPPPISQSGFLLKVKFVVHESLHPKDTNCERKAHFEDVCSQTLQQLRLELAPALPHALLDGGHYFIPVGISSRPAKLPDGVDGDEVDAFCEDQNSCFLWRKHVCILSLQENSRASRLQKPDGPDVLDRIQILGIRVDVRSASVWLVPVLPSKPVRFFSIVVPENRS